MRALVAVAFLMLVGRVEAQSKGQPDTPEQAAAAVLAAARADDAALAKLAARDDPDPWLVVDELCREGEFDAAEAFALAAPRPDTEKLPGYVAAQRGREPNPAAREAQAAANVALAAGEFERMLALIAPLKPDGSDVVSVRLMHGIGEAHRCLGRPEGVKLLLDAAAAAERLGWLARAAALQLHAGTVAWQFSDFGAAEQSYRLCLALCERRGDRRGEAEALGCIGPFYLRRGEVDKAREILEKALEGQTAAGDRKSAARTLGNLAIVFSTMGDVDRALDCHERALVEKRAVKDFHDAAVTLLNIAEIHRSRGDYPTALRMCLQALAEAEAIPAPDVVALAQGRIASIHDRTGDYEKALEFCQLALKGQAAVGDRSGVADSHHLIGLVRFHMGEYREALEAFERALQSHRELGNRQRVARTLASIGAVHEAIGDYSQARRVTEGALREQQALGDQSGIATSLQNLGNIHFRLGEFETALDCQRRALETFRRMGQRLDVGTALIGIGAVYTATGDFEQALRYFEDALVEFRAVGDRGEVSLALMNIGHTHLRAGELTRAVTAYRQVLEDARTAGDRGREADALRTLGDYYDSTSDGEQALACYRQSAEICEAQGDPGGIARSCSDLAAIHTKRGEAGKALEYAHRALQLEEAVGRLNRVASALNLIGTIHFTLGDYDRALAFHQRALERYEATGNRGGVATTMAMIANIHICKEEYEQAIELLGKVLEEHRALGMRGNASLTLGVLGLAYERKGDYEQALQFHQRALQEFEDQGNRHDAAICLADIAAVHRARHEYDQALELLHRSWTEQEALGSRNRAAAVMADIAKTQFLAGQLEEARQAAHEAIARLPDLTGGLAEEESASLRTRFAPAFEVGLFASARLHDPAGGLEFVESGRAASLLEALGGRDRIRDTVVPAALRQLEAQARAMEQAALARYRHALGRGERAPELFKEVQRARDEIDDVARRIQRHAKSKADLVYPRPKPLDAIQAALRSEEALVLYFAGEVRTVAVVVRPDEARIVPVGDTRLIEQASDDLAKAAADPRSEVEEARKRLRALVVAPLDLDPKVKRLLVSPAGRLSYLPFALLDSREVACVPSGTVYWFLRDEAPEALGTEVLALGDPDYSRAEKVLPLPGSGEEAAEVGDVVLRGKQATLAGFFAALAGRPRWRAVHLACHGRIDPERPALSSLALTPTGEDDGFLRCLDVYRSKIPADLVVLSACETGRGKVYRAEGMIGFTRAFMFAGAPRVLVSLWKVDDAATKALMVKFYELWKTQPAAIALRDAQRFVASRKEWSHPYFWAAWQLWGLPD